MHVSVDPRAPAACAPISPVTSSRHRPTTPSPHLRNPPCVVTILTVHRLGPPHIVDVRLMPPPFASLAKFGECRDVAFSPILFYLDNLLVM
jgi:hypothetical protein